MCLSSSHYISFTLTATTSTSPFRKIVININIVRYVIRILRKHPFFLYKLILASTLFIRAFIFAINIYKKKQKIELKKQKKSEYCRKIVMVILTAFIGTTQYQCTCMYKYILLLYQKLR